MSVVAFIDGPADNIALLNSATIIAAKSAANAL